MSFCQRCELLTIDELVENDVLFHPDLATLRGSAETGCGFCTLCWTALRTGQKDQLDKLLRGESAWAKGEAWTPTIWLRGMHFWDGGSAGTKIEVSCGKVKTAATDAGDEREPYENPNPHVGNWLEVYELPGKPSKYQLRGRRTTVDRDPELYIPMIKQWLANCTKSHETCHQTTSERDMPTRVIDVEFDFNRVRLITTEGIQEPEPYIALSYCWGVDTSGLFTLNKQTFAAMTDGHGLPDSKLAKTHREVISLVRALGHRYLWIDALCIIQGDAEDWEKESKTMARVYGNAALTVIAGRSASTKDGFITNDLGKDKARPPPCQLPIDSSSLPRTLTIDLRRVATMGPVSGRGWCFQERIISTRAVVFGDEQIFYTCAAGYCFENGETRPNTLRPKFLQQPSAPATKKPPSGKGPVLTPTEEVLKEWYTILTNFTTCALSNPHDVFAALMAVAQEASKALPPGTRYLAGIWECDVIRGLLWRPCYHFQVGPMSHTVTTRPKSTRLIRETGGSVVRSPSWSWAAVEGPVAHSVFTPLLVARYRDEEGWWMVRPTHGTEKPYRWSNDDRTAAVNELYMPAYDLHLTGRVAEVRVLEEPVASYFAGRKWSKLSAAKAKTNGVLLASPDHLGDGELQTWEHVVGIGFFDVKDERIGVQSVWCLPIARDLGLILERKSDGKLARLGWFVVEKESWFLARPEQDICLC
ncbi:heterokaryon incompatibility protein-domain-containing protein [Rhypophila decipiens]|uniref:Heterokaryon incompatibility protein-domain-containing protein n=1 Tax=Rhypophila decipiens TaxID=261697 RepID=A0AAN7AZ21_9PEZI|nr:heterokaryon incompatibility protein-domain-containing protein [Rhypophila decipiens]